MASSLKENLFKPGDAVTQLLVCDHRLPLLGTQTSDFANTLEGMATEPKQIEALEQAQDELVNQLLQRLMTKHEETGAHLQRTSHYSKCMALKLGWTEAKAELLFRAAPLHDIGKLQVPDAILDKPGPLTPQEWQVMRQHPLLGAKLLDDLSTPLLQMSQEIALTHHERWDGSGYPYQLRGEEIPLVGRIVMLADVYDALRSQRAYKPAFDHQTTCDIILRGDRHTRPEQFDPQLLALFPEVEAEFAAIHAEICDLQRKSS